MAQGRVCLHQKPVGTLSNRDGTYEFAYDAEYCATVNAQAISLTLPVRPEPYRSRTLHPFFDGLIPEGWLLEVAAQNWKINPRDRFELLLTFCGNCIDAVSVSRLEER
ncbi:MAG TPA: HipA N-terminal domain-containing protein [Fibrobacteraceae bacterium]|nr:HipA N-terminal domain-containing protein [Fibrobacteraceae bacterium]